VGSSTNGQWTRELTPYETAIVRKFEAALIQAREEVQLEYMRGYVRWLERLCADMRALNAELPALLAEFGIDVPRTRG
jgi:hypothetical protein